MKTSKALIVHDCDQVSVIDKHVDPNHAKDVVPLTMSIDHANMHAILDHHCNRMEERSEPQAVETHIRLFCTCMQACDQGLRLHQTA